MASPQARESPGLEEQMRAMILENGQISSAPDTDPSHRRRPQGRGGFSGGDHQNAHQPSSPTVSTQVSQDANQHPASSRGNHRQSQRITVQRGNHGNQPGTPTANAPISRGARPQNQPAPASHIPPHLRRFHQPGPPQSNEPVSILKRPQRQQQVHQQAQGQQTHSPIQQHMPEPPSNPLAVIEYLNTLAEQCVPQVQITEAEIQEKFAFCNQLEALFQAALAEHYSTDMVSFILVTFGSVASGFATRGSDMDLAIVPKWTNDSKKNTEMIIDPDIPRILEKAVLDANMGARLLAKTRVPILKVCQNPSEALFAALSKERKKWENPSDDLQSPSQNTNPEPSPLSPIPPVRLNEGKPAEILPNANAHGFASQVKNDAAINQDGTIKNPKSANSPEGKGRANNQDSNCRTGKRWLRERQLGPLDFPKSGVGIQCDINFENPLGILNTHLLRCYLHTDPRVRPMVLFVKHWAKCRKINSSYSGTLSSYGWVLMVLHYLVNIAQPRVCPNLQLFCPSTDEETQKFFRGYQFGNYTVNFWSNVEEIEDAARTKQLTQNRQSLGVLLEGFFEYFAGPHDFSVNRRQRTFHWMHQVLSLRTQGGIRSKTEKDWTSAKTTVKAGKQVNNKYLFAIEDPFELDHNVARTVGHRGIVLIRDEFRRACRIMGQLAHGMEVDGGLLDEVVEEQPDLSPNPAATKDSVHAKPTDNGAVHSVNDGTEKNSDNRNEIHVSIPAQQVNDRNVKSAGNRSETSTTPSKEMESEHFSFQGGDGNRGVPPVPFPFSFSFSEPPKEQGSEPLKSRGNRNKTPSVVRNGHPPAKQLKGESSKSGKDERSKTPTTVQNISTPSRKTKGKSLSSPRSDDNNGAPRSRFAHLFVTPPKNQENESSSGDNKRTGSHAIKQTANAPSNGPTG